MITKIGIESDFSLELLNPILQLRNHLGVKAPERGLNTARLRVKLRIKGVLSPPLAALHHALVILQHSGYVQVGLSQLHALSTSTYCWELDLILYNHFPVVVETEIGIGLGDVFGEQLFAEILECFLESRVVEDPSV